MTQTGHIIYIIWDFQKLRPTSVLGTYLAACKGQSDCQHRRVHAAWISPQPRWSRRNSGTTCHDTDNTALYRAPFFIINYNSLSIYQFFVSSNTTSNVPHLRWVDRRVDEWRVDTWTDIHGWSILLVGKFSDRLNSSGTILLGPTTSGPIQAPRVTWRFATAKAYPRQGRMTHHVSWDG